MISLNLAASSTAVKRHLFYEKITAFYQKKLD